jgi:glyoxylase-like metal-dependent hydrolase (beta-lactamase superfamily II)
LSAAALEDEFGDIIGKARRGHGVQLEDLARRTEIDAADLRQMESCERHPNRNENDRLAVELSLHPGSLWDVATDAWRPQEQAPSLEGGLQVRMIPYPPMRVTMYIMGDPASGEALVVDPGAVPDTLLEILRGAGWRVAAYVITHGDADHISALADVYASAPAPVWAHKDVLSQVSGVDGQHLQIATGEESFVAGPFELRALETPGHAAGHLAYTIRDGVLVGDTVFAGSIGGTSLGSRYYPRQIADICSKLLTLCDDTKLFPGHGPPTTVGEEKQHNPFLAAGPNV